MGTVGAMEEVGEEVGAVSLEGGAVDTFHSYAKTASPASTGLTDLIDKVTSYTVVDIISGQSA